MNLSNSIIANEKGIIQHVGEGILPYIDLSKTHPFAYPSGKLEKNDIVLLISRNLQDACTASFERIGISSDNTGPNILFLGVYYNDEVQSIEKMGNEMFETSSLLLDTFFCGNDINISWNAEELKLRISINQQYLECILDQYSDQLLIIREGEIRYFSDITRKHRMNSIENILTGEVFKGYINKKHIRDMSLQDIFPTDIYEHINNSVESREKCFLYNGKSAILNMEHLTIGEDTLCCYTIREANDILNELRSQSLSFKNLDTFSNDISSGNLPPSTFRFLGRDDHLSEVKILLQKASNTNVSILLTGESGTGKTFLAKEIHKNSKRSHNEFIHVNCAAIPYHLIESELFGYEDGAFTGAKRGGKKGYFELAGSGTIFLDEIAEIPMELQGKLLEVIQNRTFYRVGGSEKINVNARLIFATNHDLKERVASLKLREDLYYRINVFPIQLQPLRKRKEVIFNITTDILPKICKSLEIEPLLIDSTAMDKLKNYNWPGNIRELENMLERAAILCNGKIIMADDIMTPVSVVTETLPLTLKEKVEACERNAIIEALNNHNGDKEEAAKSLDIGRTNMYNKINKYKIINSSSWRKNNDSE